MTDSPRHSCVSDSLFAEYICDDGDQTTVISIPPDLLPQAMAEWEKIRDLLAARERKPIEDGTHDKSPRPESPG